MTAPAITTESKAKSRRAVLAGALGGLGAWAASAVGRASPVRAEGEAIVVGGEYTTATSVTRIRNKANNQEVFRAESAAGGSGVVGQSKSQAGVWGISNTGVGVVARSYTGIGLEASSKYGRAIDGIALNTGQTSVRGYKHTSGNAVVGEINSYSSGSAATVGRTNGTGPGMWGLATTGSGVLGTSGGGTGVEATSQTGIGVRARTDAVDRAAVLGHGRGLSTGVLGFSGSGAPPPPMALTGVFGRAAGRGSNGVRGETTNGFAIRGVATTGTALYATSASGVALRTSGRLRLEQVSGLATLGPDMTSVDVTPGVDVTTSAFVLLTPRANLGGRDLWYTTDPTANTFTIWLSEAPGALTQVAWLLVG